MKDEIKEILEEVNKIIDNTVYNEEYSYFEVSHISKLLDYITNLQAIEQQYSAILSENAELENKITNLQEELESKNKEIKNLKNRLYAITTKFN